MEDWMLPVIQLDRCNKCGLCVKYCPTQAVEMANIEPNGLQPVIVRAQDCVYCGACEEICPVHAIGLTYEITPLNQDAKTKSSLEEM